MAVYRVSNINGRFDHVAGKAAAVRRAAEISDAPTDTPEADLVREWGATIRRVTAAQARSVGMGD